MDRFIGLTEPPPVASGENLKSNMDRFIDTAIRCPEPFEIYLKSNMDRFIVSLAVPSDDLIKLFKIQYG